MILVVAVESYQIRWQLMPDPAVQDNSSSAVVEELAGAMLTTRLSDVPIWSCVVLPAGGRGKSAAGSYVATHFKL